MRPQTRSLVNAFHEAIDFIAEEAFNLSALSILVLDEFPTAVTEPGVFRNAMN